MSDSQEEIIKRKRPIPAFTDDTFKAHLPEYLQASYSTYFTPIEIAELAAKWLTADGKKRILDIGAGIGKFCISGARISNSFFYGVEYRQSLVEISHKLIDVFGVSNATVIHKDIIDVDFSDFDAFYIFNPFYENLSDTESMNSEVDLDDGLYEYYSDYTKSQLDMAKTGTRLVTYYGEEHDVPYSYELVSESGYLRYWEKVR